MLCNPTSNLARTVWVRCTYNRHYCPASCCPICLPGRHIASCSSRPLKGRVLTQATRRGVWVSNIPSAGMGNALSCAEMCFYLMLALLRR